MSRDFRIHGVPRGTRRLAVFLVLLPVGCSSEHLYRAQDRRIEDLRKQQERLDDVLARTNAALAEQAGRGEQNAARVTRVELEQESAQATARLTAQKLDDAAQGRTRWEERFRAQEARLASAEQSVTQLGAVVKSLESQLVAPPLTFAQRTGRLPEPPREAEPEPISRAAAPMAAPAPPPPAAGASPGLVAIKYAGIFLGGALLTLLGLRAARNFALLGPKMLERLGLGARASPVATSPAAGSPAAAPVPQDWSAEELVSETLPEVPATAEFIEEEPTDPGATTDAIGEAGKQALVDTETPAEEHSTQPYASAGHSSPQPAPPAAPRAPPARSASQRRMVATGSVRISKDAPAASELEQSPPPQHAPPAPTRSWRSPAVGAEVPRAPGGAPRDTTSIAAEAPSDLNAATQLLGEFEGAGDQGETQRLEAAAPEPPRPPTQPSQRLSVRIVEAAGELRPALRPAPKKVAAQDVELLAELEDIIGSKIEDRVK